MLAGVTKSNFPLHAHVMCHHASCKYKFNFPHYYYIHIGLIIIIYNLGLFLVSHSEWSAISNSYFVNSFWFWKFSSSFRYFNEISIQTRAHGIADQYIDRVWLLLIASIPSGYKKSIQFNARLSQFYSCLYGSKLQAQSIFFHQWIFLWQLLLLLLLLSMC